MSNTGNEVRDAAGTKRREVISLSVESNVHWLLFDILSCVGLHAPWKFVPGQLQAECWQLIHHTSFCSDLSLVLFAFQTPGDLALGDIQHLMGFLCTCSIRMFVLLKSNLVYHHFVGTQHHTIGADSEVIILSQVGKNHLQPGVGSVQVGGNLVSLHLMVSPHSTDQNSHGRSNCVSKVLGLMV